MKKTILLLLFLAFSFSVKAQLHGYKWRFGISFGPTNYLGDIKPLNVNNFQNFTKLYNRYKIYSEQLSYQFSAEYALGNSVGLMFTAGSYQFGAGDRFVQNDGNLFTESPQFNRALNFQTNLFDTGLSFVFKPDNNWLLSGKSFIAPYFVLGIGIQTFSSSGDLLDADGNQYDYTNLDLIPDGTFETKLRELETELPGGYKSTTIYAHLGLGFRVKITKQLEFFAQTDFKRAGTDYLDDISGVYRTDYENDFQAYAAKPGTNLITPENPQRGFENLRPDWYIYNGIGIKYSIGANKKSFNPPVISQRYTYVPSELAQKQRSQADSSQIVGNNYFTVIQLPGNQSTSQGKSSANLAELDSLSQAESFLKQELIRANSELRVIEQSRQATVQNRSLTDSAKSQQMANLEVTENSKKTEIEGLISQMSITEQKIVAIKSASSISTVDSAAMIRELIIYPGQVSRILLSGSDGGSLILDSAYQQQQRQPNSQDGSLTKAQLDQEMERFRTELLRSQATRDSAMIMAFASRTQVEPANTTQEVLVTTESLDEKSQKKYQKNLKKQQELEEKNNELIKGALLVGGTAAATAAITNDKNEESLETGSSGDSLLLAKIAQDSLIIDSLSRIPHIPDSINQKTAQEDIIKNSKTQVYFEINNAILSKEELRKIEEISTFVRENPELKINLIGYADNTGSVSYNLELTQRRVEYVRKLLIEKSGIPKERISVSEGGLIVRGSSKTSSNDDRKVEIQLYLD